MPLRTLLILIAVAIIVMAARRLFAGRQTGRRTTTQSGKMVQCATCGMYVPESEAVAGSGRYYCSRQHLEDDSRHS
jgi:uncharacterized protein